MANVAFPDGSVSLFNPAAYGEASAEARKANSPGTKKSGKNPGLKKNSFVSFFEKAALGGVKELPLSEESLHELLEEVHSAGDSLVKRPFPPEIKAYKEAVRNFVHYVVEHSFDTETLESGVNVLKRKKYTLVQVIDKKLEDMAASILRGQAGQLDILTKLDEIKGLLVDLTR
ncbi:MAG: DUF327 family protein [Treponema sp.]|jgi:uncharacterized protein YaaR (DUF327 family)|nr:DUF327 family protein [Treponema sp.]